MQAQAHHLAYVELVLSTELAINPPSPKPCPERANPLLLQASSADRAVRSEYERRRLPLLFDDLAERGLLDTHSPGRGGEATELLLRVDRLWKEFGAQGQRGTTGRGRSRSRSGGREARRSASPPQRKRRRSRSASPLRRGRRRSRSRSAEWRRPAAEPGREPLLAPVRLQQYRPHAAPGEAPVRDEWVLTGPVVMITGLPSGTSVVDVERLIGDAGGTGAADALGAPTAMQRSVSALRGRSAATPC